MNEKIALLTAMQVASVPVTELKSALHTAGILIDESFTLSDYPGCILFVDKAQQLPWLEQMLHVNAAGGIQNIVIWGGSNSVGPRYGVAIDVIGRKRCCPLGQSGKIISTSNFPH